MIIEAAVVGLGTCIFGVLVKIACDTHKTSESVADINDIRERTAVINDVSHQILAELKNLCGKF